MFLVYFTKSPGMFKSYMRFRIKTLFQYTSNSNAESNLHRVNASPDVPGGQRHSKLPGLFVQMADMPHFPFGPKA